MMDNHTALYLRIREKEGRLCSDELLRQLPEVPSDHFLRSEWEVRAKSSRRLISYLCRFENRLTILELGCGNGWLSNALAKATRAQIVGMDRDSPELRQASRVFRSQKNLGWVAADIFSSPFDCGVFDVVVIASAIQYFEDLVRLIETLTPMLAVRGEIHILDSPLYSFDQLPGARARSRRYYENLGFPEMDADYHHHSIESLAAYRPTWLYRPDIAVSHDSPFPWVCLRPEYPG